MSAALPVPQYDPAVRVDRDGDVATVTLDRPASKNACTGDMWVAIGRTFRELDPQRVLRRRERDPQLGLDRRADGRAA
jgi:hypothetical protein